MTKIKNLETGDHVFFVGGPFSQWHESPFLDENGQRFSHAEQYMMHGKAMLFGDRETAAKILAAATPAEQKALGRQIRNFDADVWAAEARKIVYAGNRLKFSQNSDLWFVLQETGAKALVEAADYDPVWGIKLGAYDLRCLDPSQWQGTNWLGQTLTKLRDDFNRAGFAARPDFNRAQIMHAYCHQALIIPGTDSELTTIKAIADHRKVAVPEILAAFRQASPCGMPADRGMEVPTFGEQVRSVDLQALVAANRAVIGRAWLLDENPASYVQARSVQP